MLALCQHVLPARVLGPFHVLVWGALAALGGVRLGGAGYLCLWGGLRFSSGNAVVLGWGGGRPGWAWVLFGSRAGLRILLL